jgi:hypothetical protein
MQQKKHLEIVGILQIIELAFQMNPSGKRKNSKNALLEQLGLPMASTENLESKFLANRILSYPNDF